MISESFSAEWLRQREPHDRAARDAAAAMLDEASIARALARPGGELQAIDLGAGTGANLRYLAPRLGGRQRWRVLDHDAALLAAWPDLMSAWALTLGGECHLRADGSLRLEAPGLRLTVLRQQGDLSQALPAAAFDGIGLVSASALLDLMSAPALDALLGPGSAAGVAWWFALSVDGRFGWPSADVDDAFVEAAYARHQRGDKGFGPALGPQAPAFAARRLAALGHRVRQAASDWLLDREMRDAQIRGMALAASGAEPAAAPRIAAWQARRLAAPGGLRLGHQELVALPGGGTAA